ncbi:MAG: glycosyltransferase family 4 protein [Syntrophomonas sp.]
MNYMTVGLLLVGLILSIYLTHLVRKYSLLNNIVDIPNKRSSHLVVTPRGGGLAFVIVFLASLLLLYFLRLIELRYFLALAGGGGLVSVLGWKDDKADLSPKVRAVFQFLAAAWAVFWLGGFSTLNIGYAELQLSLIGSILAVIGTVWMINLYNFMDGIDGIAGTEAVSVGFICGSLLLWQHSSGLAALSFLLAASVMGFLLWNWPPAKIFMGDVGSGFLGFIFAVMMMWSEQSKVIPLIIWLLLLGVFIIDATVTLVKRLRKREKIYEAHRSHVYQLAVQAGYSHKQVTFTVLLVNIVLGMLAVLSLNYRTYLFGISIGTSIVLTGGHLILGNYFNKRIKEKVPSQTADMIEKQSYGEAAALIENPQD